MGYGGWQLVREVVVVSKGEIPLRAHNPGTGDGSPAIASGTPNEITQQRIDERTSDAIGCEKESMPASNNGSRLAKTPTPNDTNEFTTITQNKNKNEIAKTKKDQQDVHSRSGRRHRAKSFHAPCPRHERSQLASFRNLVKDAEMFDYILSGNEGKVHRPHVRASVKTVPLFTDGLWMCCVVVCV